MAAKVYTPKEIAAEIGVDPKALRKAIRDGNVIGIRVGKGHRHALSSAHVKALKAHFAAKAERAAKAASQADSPQAEG